MARIKPKEARQIQTLLAWKTADSPMFGNSNPAPTAKRSVTGRLSSAPVGTSQAAVSPHTYRLSLVAQAPKNAVKTRDHSQMGDGGALYLAKNAWFSGLLSSKEDPRIAKTNYLLPSSVPFVSLVAFC